MTDKDYDGRLLYDDDLNRYFVNLKIVGVDHTADESYWRKYFDVVSDLMYKGSTGQMQLGELTFANDAQSSSTGDIFLYDKDDDESGHTPGDPPNITEPFDGKVLLLKDAEREPAITHHELAHFVYTLRDEYEFSTGPPIRKCQDDPGTEECVMEFATGYGPLLDEHGDLASCQPDVQVWKFCSDEHQNVQFNPQHIAYGVSCWQRIDDRFERIRALDELSEAEFAIVPVTWKSLPDTSSYVFCISGLDESPSTSIAVKSSLKTWVDILTDSGDWLGFIFGLDQDQQRNSGPITSDQVEAVFVKIDETRLTTFPAVNAYEAILNLFDHEELAEQRAMLTIADEGNTGPPLGNSLDQFARRRIRMTSVTTGKDDLTRQIQNSGASPYWVGVRNLPQAKDDQTDALGLQSYLVQQFFEQTAGFSIATQLVETLPAVQVLDQETRTEKQGSDKTQEDDPGQANSLDTDRVDFELFPHRLDFPVVIETTATSAFFVLSCVDADFLDLTLLTPDGKVVDRQTPGVRTSHHALNTIWFEIETELPGLWIARIRRKKGTEAIPFQFFTAVRNPFIVLEPNVDVQNGTVAFRLRTSYGVPLDYVSGSVEVYRVELNSGARPQPVASAVLRRGWQATPAFDSQNVSSNGFFFAEMKLDSDSYLAVFKVSHAGQAVPASSPRNTYERSENEDSLTDPVPPFVREYSYPFIVD